MKEFNKALTSCLENRQVQKTLERFKRNLETIEKGVAKIKELDESLNEDTEKELRQLKNILDVQAKQLEHVSESDAVRSAVTILESHMKGTAPWRGYADVKPMAEEIAGHYKKIRISYKEKQQDTLDHQLDQIRLRPDFADLEQDEQQEVLQYIRKAFVDVDAGAVQPQLLLIRQTPDRIQEAASEAHNLIDQLVNKKDKYGDDTGPKIHTVRLGLRNRIINDPEELEQVLARLKEKCLKELNAGIRIRFEE
jgi:hypothetical protein